MGGRGVEWVEGGGGGGGRIGGMGEGGHSDVILQENTQPPFSPRLTETCLVRTFSVSIMHTMVSDMYVRSRVEVHTCSKAVLSEEEFMS